MHNPRAGRFFSVDPITKKYPELSPYQFSSNSPIYMIEFEGLEGLIFNTRGDFMGTSNAIPKLSIYFIEESPASNISNLGSISHDELVERGAWYIMNKDIQKAKSTVQYTDKNFVKLFKGGTIEGLGTFTRIGIDESNDTELERRIRLAGKKLGEHCFLFLPKRGSIVPFAQTYSGPMEAQIKSKRLHFLDVTSYVGRSSSGIDLTTDSQIDGVRNIANENGYLLDSYNGTINIFSHSHQFMSVAYKDALFRAGTSDADAIKNAIADGGGGSLSKPTDPADLYNPLDNVRLNGSFGPRPMIVFTSKGFTVNGSFSRFRTDAQKTNYGDFFNYEGKHIKSFNK